jgi:hypothetical protein
MATRFNDGAKFCRDCGGSTTVWQGETWCLRGPSQSLGPTNRKFCEHCGASVEGRDCSKFGVPATFGVGGKGAR